MAGTLNDKVENGLGSIRASRHLVIRPFSSLRLGQDVLFPAGGSLRWQVVFGYLAWLLLRQGRGGGRQRSSSATL